MIFICHTFHKCNAIGDGNLAGHFYMNLNEQFLTQLSLATVLFLTAHL